MAKYHKPRAGSTGFSPRVRAKKETPTIGKYPESLEAEPLAFLCYKAGMTQVIAKDAGKNSPTQGQDLKVPVTVLDCPPLTVFAIRAYVKGYGGYEVLTDVFADKLPKDLARAIQIPKESKSKDKEKKVDESIGDIVYIRLLVATQPKKSGIKKKTPEVMEIGIGGDVPAQWDYAKGVLGKEISVKDIFQESDMVDALAVTKGKGFQGPVKRWGIKMQKRKAQRSGHMRHVGSVGGWKPANLSWLTPMAGQMGYHNRVDYNKLIMKVAEGEDANPKGGFVGYGEVGGDYILIKGSVPGPKKRAVALRKAIRGVEAKHSYSIEIVSTNSQQGT